MEVEGVFVWQDESNATYTKWADGSPGNGNGNDNGNGNGNGNGNVEKDCVTKAMSNVE